MFVKRSIPLLLAGVAGTALSCGAAQAQTPAAQLTTAGTRIDNTASVTYSVNGTNQSIQSTTASFVVDKKVNFTVVTAQTGPTVVNLGDQNVVTTFRVTNLTNDVQDFLLDPDQQNISLGLFPGSDNFDVTSLRAYVDSNGNGRYDAGVDTQTYIDELAPDASATVFIVGNVPNQAGAQYAYNSLHVIAAAGGQANTQGAILVSTDLNLAGADNVVDIVFADDDSDGALLGDIARNGQGRAYSGWHVAVNNVALSVTKSARVLADGLGSANPKAIPGATVEYCLLVRNATLTTGANAITLNDAIPGHTTYVPGSISIGTPGALGVACNVNGSVEDDDADDATETDGYTAAFDGVAKKVTVNLASVGGGGSVAASFKVTID